MIDLEKEIIQLTGAQSIKNTEVIQTLWSGYGMIKRYLLEGGKYPGLVVKHVDWSDQSNHPRGWNTSTSHQRKLKSYQVENCWYQEYSSLTTGQCKVPELFHYKAIKDGLLLIMEDLDHSGFDLRYNPETVQLDQVKCVLTWLANFHATFMHTSPDGLWDIGTYWHLDTRPDEWGDMRNKDLKAAASAIDQRLQDSTFQTLVHGDAKLANFCFGQANQVAAVDFQYVGRGCGMKDVAYFLSSCFEEEECERYEDLLLGHYFEALKQALPSAFDFNSLEEEWRPLYAFAWADFYRFLDGWSPGHWKMHGYSKRLTQGVIEQLE
ncbi:MAG: phosphotransferase [Cytophagales bacterium]|nr:phosphotransferase [Cytophagales bacterium]